MNTSKPAPTYIIPDMHDPEPACRVHLLARLFDLPVPELLAEDGAPHPELFDFCDKLDISLDTIFRGERGPRESISLAQFVVSYMELKKEQPDIAEKVLPALRDMQDNGTPPEEAVLKQGLPQVSETD